MLFQEALSLLKSGAHVRRKAWAPEEGFLSLMPGMLYVWKIVTVPNPNAGNFIFSVEDFTSDDWELFPSAANDCPEDQTVPDAA